jgi:ketosteroid isomerase-like protein
MSTDPGEVVRRLVVAFNAFDIDAVIALCSPDVVVEENPAFPDASTYHGHDGVRAMLAGWSESFDDWHTDVQEITVAGDRVTLHGTYEGVGRITGAPVKMPPERAVYVVRGGQVVSARFGVPA